MFLCEIDLKTRIIKETTVFDHVLLGQSKYITYDLKNNFFASFESISTVTCNGCLFQDIKCHFPDHITFRKG